MRPSLTATQIERLRRLNAILVETPLFKRVYDTATLAMEMAPVSPEPDCLVALGLAGSGKSTIAKTLVERHPPTEGNHGRSIPVLSVDVPSAASSNGLAITLLAALGDPAFDRGTVAVKTERLYTLLKRCNVRLIIMDEFHHLIDEDRKTVLKNSADWLKVLINKMGIPVFLLGVHKSTVILDVSEQLRRRFPNIIDLAPYDWGNADSRLTFRKVIKAVDQLLPFETPANLSSTDSAFALYQSSSGLIGHLMRVIRTAAQAAILADEAALTAPRLARAYEEVIVHLHRRSIGTTIPNPFTDPEIGNRSHISPGCLSEIETPLRPTRRAIGSILSTR